MKIRALAYIFLSLPAGVLPALALHGCAAPVDEVDLEPGEFSGAEEETEEAEDALVQSNVLTNTDVTLPQVKSGTTTLACENRWTVRQFVPQQSPIVPRRQYAASCQPKVDAPHRIYISTTITNDQTLNPAGGDDFDGTSGLILAYDVDAANKATLVSSRHLSECKEVAGISASSTCDVVSVLCRRNANDSQGSVAQESVDMVEKFAPAGATPNPTVYSALKVAGFDEEWLYEMTGAPVNPSSAALSRWVVNKTIGRQWEYGHKGLAYNPAGQTYGISLKTSTAPDAGGTSHEREQFLLVNRTTKAIDPVRSVLPGGQCNGHPIANRVAFSPISGKYAYLCGTDKAAFGESGTYAGINLVVPKKDAASSQLVTPVRTLPMFKASYFDGGAGNIIPLSDGGFLGVIVAPKTGASFSSAQDYQKNGPLAAIHVVRFGADGRLAWTKLVRSSATNFLGQAQIAKLADNRYLIGYAVMATQAEANVPATHNLLRIPRTYKTVEVDVSGNVIADTDVTLTDAGWGEQDQMVPLGPKRAGWVYIPTPQAKNVNGTWTYPACFSNKLRISIYKR